MTEFVASNGIRVYLDEHGGVVWAGGSQNGEPKQKVTQAFREFFLAERDTELGRWRSKEHPEYVVYDHGDGRVRVMRDTHGNSYSFDRESIHRFYLPNDAEIAFQRVAREFFAAHPEPKPWHDAKPGEVWALTDTNGATAQYLADQRRFFKLPLLEPREPCWQPAGFASDFTAGRRIWPEVSNV